MTSNIIFPLPLPVHIAFGVIGVLFFLFMYRRKNYFYYLLLAGAIASTLLVFACDTKFSRGILGIEELILYVVIIVSMCITRKRVEKEQNNSVAEVKADENGNS